MRIPATLFAALLLLTLACCGRTESRAHRDALNSVLTTFHPTEYIASRISGGLVPVECPLPEGQDPASWQPDATALERYQNAGLVVLNGASFEQWTRLASLPFSRTCDSTAGFAADFITFESAKHRHGSEGEHSHEGTDGHTWLDPVNSRHQTEAILLAMSRRWPEHEKVFRDNAERLLADLDRLDERLKAASQAGPVRVIASHPAYNYIGRRYGWEVRNVDVPPEGPIGDEARRMLSAPDSAGAFLLFESDPSPAVVAALREARVVYTTFSPGESLDAASREAGMSYLTVMNDNIDRLTAALHNARTVSTTTPETP